MTNHKPLRDRENALSADVADAIANIIGRASNGLPTAVSKAMVVRELIQISCTDENGIYIQPSISDRAGKTGLYRSRVDKGNVFKDGYKAYADAHKKAVVPVVDYFFSQVWANGEVADALDAMTLTEVKASLPRRPGYVKVLNDPDDPSQGFSYLCDTDGNPVYVGEEGVTGIVVFPTNMRSLLLHYWQKRRKLMWDGLTQSNIASLRHATPTVGPKLASPAGVLSQVMGRALPKPHTPPPPSDDDDDEDDPV